VVSAKSSYGLPALQLVLDTQIHRKYFPFHESEKNRLSAVDFMVDIFTHMKILTIILLSCVSALAADNGVRLVSSVATTNSLGIYTTETFTRGSQTNLVRVTGSQGGVVTYLSHQFYHHGHLVAVITGTPNPSSYDIADGLPCQISLRFAPSKDISSLHINSKDLNERFDVTNGVFYPAPDSELGNWGHTNRVYNPATDPVIPVKDKQ
jgi:hypothetical protein